MAEEDKKKDKGEDEAPPAAGVNKGLLIAVIVLGVVLVVGASVGLTAYFMVDKYGGENIEAIDESIRIDVEHPIEKVNRSERDPKEMGFENRGIALYHKIDPPFLAVLSDTDKKSYLKVEVSIMARNPNTLEAVRRHEPLIKNDLLTLFASQSSQSLLKPKGRELLQGKVKKVVNKVIGEHSDAPGIEDVLFINYLVQ
jgi:flagellar FliL protein